MQTAHTIIPQFKAERWSEGLNNLKDRQLIRRRYRSPNLLCVISTCWVEPFVKLLFPEHFVQSKADLYGLSSVLPTMNISLPVVLLLRCWRNGVEKNSLNFNIVALIGLEILGQLCNLVN